MAELLGSALFVNLDGHRPPNNEVACPRCGETLKASEQDLSSGMMLFTMLCRCMFVAPKGSSHSGPVHLG